MYDLHDNDFMLLPPEISHYTSYLFGDCRRCCIYFRKEDLNEDLFEMMPSGEAFFDQLRIFQVSDINRRKIDDTLKQMSDEEIYNDKPSPILLGMLLNVLLMQCSRICSFLPDAPSKIFTADPQVLQAARFINENYRLQLNAADIAGAVGFSPNYLSRKFKDTTGMGVHEYLIYVRLRNAAFELRSTSLSVTDIALQCGFSNSNYFKDVFKKYYNMTPREYRKTR
jgi:AraC-like DNA-binding protein